MLPTGVTVASLFTGAQGVVGYFADVMILVVTIGIGVWAVRFVIGQIRRGVK